MLVSRHTQLLRWCFGYNLLLNRVIKIDQVIHLFTIYVNSIYRHILCTALNITLS